MRELAYSETPGRTLTALLHSRVRQVRVGKGTNGKRISCLGKTAGSEGTQ